MLVGVISDVHTHRHEHASEIARLIDYINDSPLPDVLIFAGDISHRTVEIRMFLEAIDLPCPKCWIPGNHDIWVIDAESDKDTSEYRYHTIFPDLSSAAGWHYLPSEPLFLNASHVSVVGTLGWFTGQGFSEWFDTEASERDEHLAEHFAQNLISLIEQTPVETSLLVVTHHLCHSSVPSFDRSKDNIWNRYLQEVLSKYKDRILLAIHGHIHTRYDPIVLDEILFMAHPFGYPHQHECAQDGYRMIDVMLPSQ